MALVSCVNICMVCRSSGDETGHQNRITTAIPHHLHKSRRCLSSQSPTGQLPGQQSCDATTPAPLAALAPWLLLCGPYGRRRLPAQQPDEQQLPQRHDSSEREQLFALQTHIENDMSDGCSAVH